MAQINKPSEHINTVLYTGNGSSQSVTGVGFQPDLCIFKNRDQALNPTVVDAVRGLKYLYTTEPGGEGDYSSNFTSFDSDGFSVGTAANVNGSGDDMLCYNWKANGSGSANTDGTISSTVSANQTSGFSIVKYTGNATSGATVGHGLNAVPKVMWVKNLDASENWSVYHNSIGNTKFLRLNQNNATTTSSTIWNDTTPTSSVFTVGNGASVNGSGNEFIAYCFAEKKGYSKFGSYIGNGSTDGTFIYTGFKPAWVLWKKTDIENWGIANNKSSPFNVVSLKVRVDTAIIEATGDNFDFVSNGFKIRTTSGEYNTSGSTYIYMAFAENPLVGTNNIPCTAR